jgi:hypothetical protein
VILDLCGLVFRAISHWLFKAGLSSRVAPRPEKQLSYLFFKDHKYGATAKQLLADDPAANPGTNRTFQRL